MKHLAQSYNEKDYSFERAHNSSVPTSATNTKQGRADVLSQKRSQAKEQGKAGAA